ncbi:MAG: hypothetical protein AAF694_27705 [Bacteroidota bacterium]
MKTNILTYTQGIIFLLCLSSYSFAQQPGILKERLESLKVAHITERLGLTSKEAQIFWPVYNEYADELEALKEAHDDLKREVRQTLLASGDEGLEDMAEQYLNYNGKKWKVQQKYHERFKKVLPIRKVIQLYKAEEDFNQKILVELARRRLKRLQNRD